MKNIQHANKPINKKDAQTKHSKPSKHRPTGK